MQKKKQTQSLFFVQILILGKTIFWRESESQDNVQGYILYTRINDFLICGIQGETQFFLGVYTFSKKHCLQKITFPEKIIYFCAEYLYPFLSLPPPFSGVRGGYCPIVPPPVYAPDNPSPHYGITIRMKSRILKFHVWPTKPRWNH